MDFTEFGWREAWMLAVMAAVAYLTVLLVRLILLRRRRSTTPAAPDTRIPVVSQPPQAAETQAPVFAEQLAWTRLEAEVKDLRTELAAARAEVAGMQAELAGMQVELSESKAARRVSPLYADAVALARRGYDARGIAEECGISVAEAELVLSMSSGGQNFDDEVNDGGSGSVEPAGRR